MAQKILIVDDEKDELEGWEQLLKRKGYRVTICSTPEEALKACDQDRFDLVILDYVIPRMKGLELLARIRGTLPMVRSILVSGKLDETVAATAFRESIRSEVEVDNYLHKPVSNEDLANAVSELLNSQTPSRPWNEIADTILQGNKTTVKRAKAAQRKLKNHLRKR